MDEFTWENILKVGMSFLVGSGLMLAIMRGKVKNVWQALVFLAKRIENQEAGEVPLGSLVDNPEAMGRKKAEAQFGARLLKKSIKERVPTLASGTAKVLSEAAECVDKKKDVKKRRPVLRFLRGVAGVAMRNL